MRKYLPIVLLLLGACAAPTAPPPSPAPPVPESAKEEAVTGSVRVTATALNVRRDPKMDAEVVAQVKKGQRLDLLATGDSWAKVRVGGGMIGWVAAQYVAKDDGKPLAVPRATKRGCLPDSDFAFAEVPTPTFSDSSAHGLVVVDATVDAKGNVQSTKLVSNSTGDEALGFLTEREIQKAKFIAPVRNCAPRAFIFTYKRSF